ncbi:headcase protein homolog [Babylonia areolata]|uniref:headcase protein homolog n=1 Tax=Babylonia areolata TaxID=304850 RepID=UPI003FD36BBD
MPNSRHQRNHRHRDEDAHNNNQQAAAIPAVNPREVGVGNTTGHHVRQNDNNGAQLQKCCSPGSCRFPDEAIDPEDAFDAVKVVCNNENCGEGTWMHKDCFEDFEQSVLAYLRSCGRARSWSEKQRLQNLWTKKGYDLAFKACDCKCGRGHLRKDLDYIPPPFNENKKHKKHKKKNDKPMPVVSTTHKSNSHSSQAAQHLNGNGNSASTTVNNNPVSSAGVRSKSSSSRTKTGRKTSTSTRPEHQSNDNNGNIEQQDYLDNQTGGSTHIPTSTQQNTSDAVFNMFSSNAHPQMRHRTNSVSSIGSVGSHSSSISSIPSSAGSASPISSSPVSGDMFFKTRKSSDASTDNGPVSAMGFRQRLNLSAFASLPRNKQNPYHIRMEDANTLAYAFTSSCSIGAAKVHPHADMSAEAGGCDVETRNFVLSNLLNKKMCSTRCALCKVHLPVFDCFPLLDGTFFLSPQSYDEVAIQVIWDGRLQFLNAACIACLEGQNIVKCVACKQPWDGRNLVIGSMYTYDIFAAVPCCQKRLTCKCCRRAVIDINKGLDYYSQYSHMIICPYCKANDYHFIRSLTETFLTSEESGGLRGLICQ